MDDDVTATPTTWVVGVDGSDHAQTALRWTLAQALAHRGRVRAVTAWMYPYVGAYPMAGTIAAPALGDLAASAVESLAKAVAEAVAEVPGASDLVVEQRVVEGPGTQVLLDQAAQGDVLVVGTRGRGGFARLMLGSVSSQCAAHAIVPTVVVPAETPPVMVSRVAVGVDGSPNADQAVRWATQLVPAAAVTAVHGWIMPVGGMETVDAAVMQDCAEGARQRFDTMVDRLDRDLGTHLARHFVPDDPRQALVEAGHEADLLVVGTQGHRGLVGWVLGSTTTWLLHHPPCPVAVVPAAA